MNIIASSIQSIKRGRYYKVLRQPVLSGEDPILLPLGLYQSLASDEVAGSAESAFKSSEVGIQALNREAGEVIEGFMPEGWLYIFVNGHLWHEYEIDADGLFRGINLQYQQTLDHRRATGIPSQQIVYPTIMEGEECTVQIAFSQVQWSWARLLSLGGMSPEDVRLKHWVQNGEYLSGITQKYGFLESYQSLADFNGLSDASDIKAGQWLKLRDPDTALDNADDNRHLRMGVPLAEQEQFAHNMVVVQDPLGAVDLMNSAMVAANIKIDELVGEMNGAYLRPGGLTLRSLRHTSLSEDAPEYVAPDYKKFGIPENCTTKDFQQVTQMAQILYPMLFDEQSFAELDGDAQDYLTDAKEQISDTDLKEWLHVDIRKQYRDQYIKAQEMVIKFLLEQDSPYSKSSNSLGIWECLADYAWLPVVTYSQLWAKTNDLLSLILTNANSQDYSYDLPSEVKSEKSNIGAGLAVIEALLNPDHKAHSWLFASESEIDIHSPEEFKKQTTEGMPDTPTMRTGDFQASISVLLSNQEPNSNTVAGMMKKPSVGIPDVVDRFLLILDNYKKLHDVKNANSTTIDVDGLFTRFCKSTGLPVLSKVHVIDAGTDMNGLVAPGEYRIKNLIKLDAETTLNRAQRRAFTRAEVNSGATRLIDAFDENGQKIASNTLIDLKPYHGPNIDTPDIRWTDVFRDQVANTDGSVAYTSKVRMLVTPVTSWTEDMSDRLHQWAKRNSGINNTYRTLPSGLLILEVFSMGQALAALGSIELSALEKRYTIAKHAAFVAAASMEAIEAWKGPDGFIDWLGKKGKVGNFALRETPAIHLGDDIVLRVPFYRFLSIGVTLIAAADCAISTVRLVQKNDNDAAIALAVSGLLGLTSSGLFLIASNSIAPVAAWIPVWGWILAGAAVLAGLIAVWLTDSRFESWAKHCCFAKDTQKRLGQLEISDISKLSNQLQDLFFCPTLALTHNEIHENIFEVTANLQHPSFISHTSTLDWAITAKYADISNNRLWGGYSRDKTYTEDELARALKSHIVIGPPDQPTGLKLVFHFAIPELDNFLTEAIAKHHLFIHFKVRHVLPSGVSLPLNNSENDDTYADDQGWVLERLTIAD